MSGHTNFTAWIDSYAKYVVVNGEKEKIKDTFFVSSPIPNSDEFMIKLKDYSVGLNEIDFEELVNRYKKSLKRKKNK